MDTALQGLSPSKDQIVAISRYVLSRFTVLVIIYLLSFLLFALIRIFTGISIKRLGYLSLCHISYSPHPHVNFFINRIGVSLHRPTIVHPGWVSLYITDLEVTVDPEYINEHAKSKQSQQSTTNSSDQERAASTEQHTPLNEDDELVLSLIKQDSYAFHFLKFGFNHGRYIDFKATNSSFVLTNVGTILIGHLQLKIDFRENHGPSNTDKFVGTLDSHKFKKGEAPLSIKFFMSDLLFSDPSSASQLQKGDEVLDVLTVDSQGIVDRENLGVKDFSVSCRFGELNLQADKLLRAVEAYKKFTIASTPQARSTKEPNSIMKEVKFNTVLTTIVRIIKEVELKVTHFGIFKLPISYLGIPLDSSNNCAFSLKDFSLDLRRLNPKNPAFRLSFSDDDTAHQAILTCASVMFGLDAGGIQEELLYIPLITAISKTNIFSKTVNLTNHTVEERNKIILRSNINISTPSINIEPQHAGIVFGALFNSTEKKKTVKKNTSSPVNHLWPRASIKFTIDEPATRVLVHQPEGIRAPIPYAKLSLSQELSGMVVMNCSKLYCDFESNHIDINGKPNYSLQSSFQLISLESWYRSSSGLRFDFFNHDSLYLHLSADLHPEFKASITGSLDSMKLLSIHSEVLYGVRELLLHIKKNKNVQESPMVSTPSDIFLRNMPSWLCSIEFVIRKTTIAIAADELEHFITTARGVKLIFPKISINYTKNSEGILREAVSYMPTDHRQLSVAFEGFRGYKIRGIYYDTVKLDQKFLDIPTFDFSISTDRDLTGPITQVDCKIPTLEFDGDINLFYMISLCLSLVRSALLVEPTAPKPKPQTEVKSAIEYFVQVNFTTKFWKLKSLFPQNVPLMLELNDLKFIVERGKNPMLDAKALRLYTSHPSIPNSWTRVISIKGLDVEIKDKLKNIGNVCTVDYNEQILIQTEFIRIDVAYQLVVYMLFDNIITGVKCIITLFMRELTNNHKFILPLGEKNTMPNIPKLRIKSKNIFLGFEDDMFETKLNLIFQVGLREQKKRMDLDAAFEAKVDAIRKEKKNKNKEAAGFTKFKDSSTADVKASHRTQTSSAHSFIGTILNNKNTERSSTGSNLNKPKHTGTFRSLQNGINPLHLPIRRHRTHAEPQKYKLTENENVTNDYTVDIATARYQLNKNFSSTWIREFSNAEANLKQSILSQIGDSGFNDPVPPEMLNSENIVAYSPFPFLFFLLLSDVDWFISKPSKSEEEMRQFLYNVGKGLPMDTRFSIYVPLYNQLKCEAFRIQLRDYPLPLVFFPPKNSSQNLKDPAVEITGNFVIGEEFSLADSNIRRIFVPIDPLAFDHYSYPNTSNENPFMVEVHRTVASIKTYTELSFEIRSNLPSVITWGVSIQPAIQAAMQVFDQFSKPPLDPSDTIGFWDKIRSIFHARMFFKWTDGSLNFQLKGSYNPYHLIGSSAGFVFCWSNNVLLQINPNDDPQELVSVTSNEFRMTIPDFSFQEREYLLKSVDKTSGLGCMSNLQASSVFDKVIMKLGNRVKWTIGLLFERKKGTNGRTFKSKPHYDVVLSHPDFVKDLESYDAYKDFRSDFLHMAISVSSVPGNWNTSEEISNYNSVHMSPKFFSHFYKWWGLFGGANSLPIRSGNLFNSSEEKNSKKFGRHLYTVKYQLHMDPLYICHAYTKTDFSMEKNTCVQNITGLKLKVDEFKMDLHQRRAPTSNGRWKMGLNVGEIDFIGSDLRVILANFTEKSHGEILARKLGIDTDSPTSSISNGYSHESASSGKFHINDNDYSWIDFDDFKELGEGSVSKSVTRVNILPLSYTPKWTYFRKTDHGFPNTTFVPFGNEPSHICLFGQERKDSIYEDIMNNRLVELTDQLKTNDITLEVLRKDHKEFPDSKEVTTELEKTESISRMLVERITLIKELMEIHRAKRDDIQVAVDDTARDIFKNIRGRKQSVYYIDQSEMEQSTDSVHETFKDEITNMKGEFNNIFIIHSSQIKWNNAVRNAVFGYLHHVGERRNSVYYMTQKAVKYLDDLMEKQNHPKSPVTPESGENASNLHFTREVLGDILQEMRKSFDGSNNNADGDLSEKSARFDDDLRATQNEDFFATDSYWVRMVLPQIQFISDKNPDNCVLVTSESLDLKIVAINDKQRADDEAAQLVETRYGISLHEAQFFVLNKEKVQDGGFTLYGTSTYGSTKQSSLWPPWVPVECCYDSTPLSDHLIIEKSSVSLRYDKPNSLRVQSGEQVDSLKNQCTTKDIRGENHRQNRISVNFPKVVASCDSQQYFTTYTVVMDLLIYTEPEIKTRTERLDKVLLATDFSNLGSASKRIIKLQNDVRGLRELETEFVIHSSTLTDGAVDDLRNVEVEQQHALLELYMMMEALKSGMRKNSKDNDTTEFIKWTIGADQVIWHVLNDSRQPFLDVGLANASFNRIQGTDGFNSNSIEIGILQAFNLHPDSYYPEMISPYLEEGEEYDITKGHVVSINWTMLDPIGGIPIVENFDIKLKPVKVQIESKTWDAIFAYIFHKSDDGKTETESPFIIGPKRTGSNVLSTNSGDTESFYDGASFDFSSEVASIASSEQETDSDVISTIGSTTESTRESIFSRAFKKRGTASSTVTVSRRNEAQMMSHRDPSSGPLSKLGHTGSSNSLRKKALTLKNDEEKKDDEVSEMFERTLKYMSIVQISIYATVVCISFKGEGAKNILDIHEYSLRLPKIQYENKTWSNMDLVLQLKRDVTKILLSHTGGLLGNKFKRRQKKDPHQKLQQLKNYVSFTPVSELAVADSLREQENAAHSHSTDHILHPTPVSTQTSFEEAPLPHNNENTILEEEDEDSRQGIIAPDNSLISSTNSTGQQSKFSLERIDTVTNSNSGTSQGFRPISHESTNSRSGLDRSHSISSHFSKISAKLHHTPTSSSTKSKDDKSKGKLKRLF